MVTDCPLYMIAQPADVCYLFLLIFDFQIVFCHLFVLLDHFVHFHKVSRHFYSFSTYLSFMNEQNTEYITHFH